jgi:hypothetical protein
MPPGPFVLLAGRRLPDSQFVTVPVVYRTSVTLSSDFYLLG